MIININDLKVKNTEFVEDLVFNPETYKCTYPLNEIKSCHVKVVASKYDDFVEVNVYVDALVNLVSSYSLKNFDYKLHTSEEYHFGDLKDDLDSDMTPLNGIHIELDKYIFMLIAASIPMSPKAPGETLPKGGDGLRILTEEELEKELSE